MSSTQPDERGEEPLPTPHDESLVRRVRAGDDQAATLLYQRYAGRLRALVQANLSRAVASRVDEEDIVQSVFRRFFHALGQGRYALPSAEELWTLLAAITLNRLRTEEQFQRALKRDVARTVSADPSASLSRDRDSPDAVETFLTVAVSEAVQRLPARCAEVVRLRLDGFEVAEIAQRIPCSRRTVERLLQEARAELRTFLELEA